MSEDENQAVRSDREFGVMILERMEQNLGVPLRHIFENETSADVIRRQMRSAVVAAVRRKAAAETPTEDWPEPGHPDHLAALLSADDINTVPSISVTEYNLRVVSGYSGREIHDYVKTVTNGLSLIQEGQTATQVAIEMTSSGIASFSIAMIHGTIKALRAGNTFRASVTTGVRAMGSISVVVAVAALLITELLLYLMMSNQKVFLGLVYNNTDLNLRVTDWRSGTGGSSSGDLFMNTGSMTSFMETHEYDKLDSPLVQIPARLFVEPGNDDNLVLGGVFAAEKSFGFYGTEGAMAFTNLNNPGPRFFLQFACPYTMDNGVNVAIDATGSRSAKQAFKDLFGNRSLDRAAVQTPYTFRARCNSKSGGEAAGIAILTAN